MPRLRTREPQPAADACLIAPLPAGAAVELEARLHELFAEVEDLRQRMSGLRPAEPAPEPEPESAAPFRFEKLPVRVQQRPSRRPRRAAVHVPSPGTPAAELPESGPAPSPAEPAAPPPGDAAAASEDPTDLQVEVDTLNWMLELARNQAAQEQAALNAQIESLRQSRAEEETACATLRQELEEARARLRAAEAAVQEHLLEGERRQATMADLQARLAERGNAPAAELPREPAAEVARLEEALTAARTREEELQRRSEELARSLDQEEIRSRTACEDRERAIHSRQITEAELAHVRERLTELHQRLQAETQRHLQQAAAGAARLQAEERQSAELREELERRGHEALKLREDLAELRELLAQANSERSELDRETRHLRRQLEAERRRNDLVRLHARLDAVAWAHPLAVRPEPPAAPCDPPSPVAEVAPAAPAAAEVTRIVAIGASTGGPAVLEEILPVLPAEFPACLLIVQHMPPGYTAELANRLNQRTAITVREARNGDRLAPATALIAPGGHHMEVHDGTVRLSVTSPVNNVRPSVDVLFDSLLPVARRVQAVLLTGMGSDGATGMGRLRSAGAETIVQDQSSSVIWGMPGAAVKAGAAVLQMPPAKLGHYLVRRIASGSAARPARREAPREAHAAAAV